MAGDVAEMDTSYMRMKEKDGEEFGFARDQSRTSTARGELTIERLTQPRAAVPRCYQTMILIAIMVVPAAEEPWERFWEERSAAKERNRASGGGCDLCSTYPPVCHEAHFRCGII